MQEKARMVEEILCFIHKNLLASHRVPEVVQTEGAPSSGFWGPVGHQEDE